MNAPLVMLLAGGTGGHVYPALALAIELRERGYRLRWLGTRRGLEARVVPAAGIPLHCLPMRGLRGKGPLQQVWTLVLLGLSLLQSLFLLLRFRPRLVVGMGGYASFPAAVAGWLLRRPLLLQEQNAIAGSANRTLAPLAGRIATGFPDVFAGRKSARYLGNPVRSDLAAVAERHPWRFDGERPLRILVLGGSLGAQPVNEVMAETAALLGPRCEWWHQCGPTHLDSTCRSYLQQAPEIEARIDPFLEDMGAAYGWADLAICRAGALTVAELAVCGRPSILVPLPHAIDDHQTANATFLVDGGAAVLLSQDALAARALADEIIALLGEPGRLESMSVAALALGKPGAVRAIADCCEELMQ